MSWRVLLLDENPRSSTQLHQALSDLGCSVRLVGEKRTLDRAKSVARLTSERVDAVLVSVALPRLAGINVFERIHQDARRRGIPVVLVSPDVDVIARHEASATPAAGYVSRPAADDALMAELSATLVAVVGVGTRTAPPPPPDPSDPDSIHVSLEDTAVPERPRVAFPEASELTQTQPRQLRPEVLQAAGGKAAAAAARAARDDPEPTVSVATRTAKAHPDEQAVRIEQLETELHGSLELLTRAGRQLEADRAAHQEALVAAALEADDRLAEERAMGESALTSMASELHAQSIKFGKRVSEANARAREAEDRVIAERAGAVSTLAAVEAAFQAAQQELTDLREVAAVAATAQRRNAELEQELQFARAERDELAIQQEQLNGALQAERDARESAVALAQDALRAAEERHTEERSRGALKLTAAAAAFDRKQRELVETREVIAAAAVRASELEGELRLAIAARDLLQRDLNFERTAHEQAAVEASAMISATESREADARALAASTLAAVETALETERGHHAATREAAAAESASFDELLRLAGGAQDDLTAQVARLQSDLETARRSQDAAASEVGERLRAAEAQRHEEQARAAAELAEASAALSARQAELDDARAAAKTQADLVGDELRLARASIDDLTAQTEQLRRDQAAERSEHEAAVAAIESGCRAAETAHEALALEETRLRREIAAKAVEEERLLAALKAAEERIVALEARAPAPRATDEPAAGSGRPVVATSDSGEHRASRASQPAIESQRVSVPSVPPVSRRSQPAIESQRVSLPPASGEPGELRPSGPPPLKSGSRPSIRLPASLEGDRDDTPPVDRRSVLVIDGDRVGRVNTVRALARASCEVTVRDSCADVAASLAKFDVIVTEVVGVAIEELVKACRDRAQSCAIIAWTQGIDAARAMFDAAGIERVTVIQKVNRPDGLIAAVRALLDEAPKLAEGT